ncbi:unnamed protein product [Adineta ricciae]|uniref:FYVE-type domain-containing protein n=1 Tax=Adineta ricciae TaxID=249248 RepID=A0A813XBP0_ADIRI|nr:unnamed protein product [Adineta ricciae]CAF1635134.1 unnamed protein product [Adineta ricciae]
MVVTQNPPTWTDRDTCFRCRTTFTAFTRKHHCRACGETFCSSCSSKSSPLLEFGIEDEVRVCESCYDRLTTTGSVNPTPASETTSASAVAKPTEKSQAEIDEEEALQLAISLSQSEADEKERRKKLLTQQYALASIPTPPTPLGSAPIADQNDNEQKPVGGNAELAKYLDRNYWEGQTQKDLGTNIVQNDSTDNFVRDDEIDAFINVANSHINNIKFRMLSNQQRGRNIANDTAVQSVFFTLQHMYPELNRLIQSLDDKQAYHESLQDKLGQLKDAREALNALRDEHLENKRRQAFERERQRQMQLAVKLDDMRQKKHAYLEYHRQLHLQRLAEQEAEMQARLDQQRRYAQQREQQNQIDYHLSQVQSSLPYVQSLPSVAYYPHQQQHQQQQQQHVQSMPTSQIPTHSFSMGQLSDALPPPLAPPISQYQQLYSAHPPMQSNEQTLISFD